MLWSLKVIAWWSLKQRIALYCVFQWPNPKATSIEIGVYYIHRMVVLTIVAPSNDHTEHPIEKPTYIRLLSCSLYNSWYNLKTRQGQLHWLKLEPAKIQNLENCKQDISLDIFLEKQLNVVFEIKLETRVTALKKILKKLMCSLFHLLRFNEKKKDWKSLEHETFKVLNSWTRLWKTWLHCSPTTFVSWRWSWG